MSKNAKKWLIAAVCLIAAGAIMFAAVMTAYHWNFSRLSTERFETVTYEIHEAFSGIKLDTETADILFAVSGDDACSVVCHERENVKHSVSVQDGTLTVSAADDRKWYEKIGFSFDTPQVTVYLPAAEYGSLRIRTTTGDVRVSGVPAEDLDIDVTTGKVTVTDVVCNHLSSVGTTGDILLKNVTVAGRLSVERSTGDVRFDGSDAAEITVRTRTGDVTGSLLTGKAFVTETSTGDISVPGTAAGGTCEITTTTGNIKIGIAGGTENEKVR